jgi:hypothetical protein
MVDNTRRVVCAAMMHPETGFIVCGPRHHDKIMHMTLSQIDDDLNDVKWIQGFVNTWGEFLTREEAWMVACRNNQIMRYVGCQGEKDFGMPDIKLFSENLY